MKCENCNNKHNGTYGSGRFCSKECARAFSTKAKRKEINEKVSKKLKGHKTYGGFEFLSTESKSLGGKNSVKQKIIKKLNDFETLPWDELIKKYSIRILKQKILKEQNNKCNKCGIDKWTGTIIILQLHHKDGNHKNKSRDNLECLCPNCHSLTDTYGFKNKIHSNETKRKIGLKKRKIIKPL